MSVAPILLSSQIKLFQQWLPKRPKTAHKGDFGHVLVMGANPGLGGSVMMAGMAAVRTGAGLVSVLTAPEHIAAINGACPELMCFSLNDKDVFAKASKKATVIAVGPGLEESKANWKLLKQILAATQPKVVDAGALGLLAKYGCETFERENKPQNRVLTPHPGEAARLLGMTLEAVQADRLRAVLKLQEIYGGVCVLKGANTLIAGLEGKVFNCDAGNPGMATGGMGDILTGVIAGLLAQGLNPEQAACMGVMVHALAGDNCAQTHGERGMLATDLLPYIRQQINRHDAS